MNTTINQTGAADTLLNTPLGAAECVPSELRRIMPEQPLELVRVRLVPRNWKTAIRSAGLVFYFRCLQLKVALIG